MLLQQEMEQNLTLCHVCELCVLLGQCSLTEVFLVIYCTRLFLFFCFIFGNIQVRLSFDFKLCNVVFHTHSISVISLQGFL